VALEELLRLGAKGYAVIKSINGLLDKVSDARLFLHENNPRGYGTMVCSS
jgi:hypothetical protein